MTRFLGLIGAAMLISTTTLAQSGPAADPISGTWIGSAGPGAVPNYGLTMELKFDGTRTISGSAQGQDQNDTAVLKTGTFDPQTGALRLEFQLKDAGAIATFEGVAVLDTAMGRMNLSLQPGQPGTFMLTRRASPGAGAVRSTAAGDTANAAVGKRYAEVSGWISKAADLVPADKSWYRPIGTVRTFGQLIAHIADSHNFECGRAAGKKLEWSDAIEKGQTDKATVLPKLKASIDGCTAAHGSGQADPLIANLAHSSLHYGNVVTYLRMLGLVPPSS